MIRTRRAVVLLMGMLAALLGAGTYHAASRADLTPPTPPKPITMKLRRMCWTCPNYVIVLTSDGMLTYEGHDNALVAGAHRYKVDRVVVQDMLMKFLESGYLELENSYPSPGADKMTVYLSIEMSDLTKAVMSEDRYGPNLLIELERAMDDLPGMRALSGWVH
jgi:hypothetical protein